MINTDVNRYGATQITLAQALRSEPADPAKTPVPSGGETRAAGPAVVLSLSPAAKAAMDRLNGDGGANATIVSRLNEAGRMPLMSALADDSNAFEKALEEAGNAREAVITKYFDLFKQKMHDDAEFAPVFSARSQLSEKEEKYNKLLTIKPVPAVVLEGKEKEAVLKLASDRGLSIGGYDTLGFGDENFLYMIYKDGTVTKNDGDTPTSEQFKQQILESLKEQIDLAQIDTTDYEKRTAVRDKELAELSALVRDNMPGRN
ncbi:hypothetical protein IPV08_04030 [Methylobacterium sp. SD274]|uniref:hypothetical protein n=1 Tax=Methylobacterium sp. SD274 TaxID=2782009 RepID=UPI001A95CD6B|nr:hypothetical protein [Methylobacterium sp. SD274]MBO1019136.1 hypothetical protein [Methylobacterium sp. SD274]